jgi:hypothetical protein
LLATAAAAAATAADAFIAKCSNATRAAMAMTHTPSLTSLCRNANAHGNSSSCGTLVIQQLSAASIARRNPAHNGKLLKQVAWPPRPNCDCMRFIPPTQTQGCALSALTPHLEWSLVYLNAGKPSSLTLCTFMMLYADALPLPLHDLPSNGGRRHVSQYMRRC